MKILVIAANYPHSGYRFSGIFNERSVQALTQLCERVEVLVPKPYVPPLVSLLVPRWRSYSATVPYEFKNGVAIWRPCVPVVPRIAQAFWVNEGAFLWCREKVRRIHKHSAFDAIISFDLAGAGGLAWRLGRDLRIPVVGWSTGSDIRFPSFSAHGRAVARALRELDLVFYQSRELREKAAGLLGVSSEKLAGDRHIVLSRGIPEPPEVPKTEVRNRLRAKWGIKEEEIVVLYLGRISQKKGIMELLQALTLATSKDPRIRCVLVGSKPAVDDTSLVEKLMRENARLRARAILLPECCPNKVWETFCAADIFAFPSHNEGMPNSLLEAMRSGLPAVAFAIPPVLELEAGTGGLVLVPSLDSGLFANAILRLSSSPEERKRISENGKCVIMDRFMVHKNMRKAVELLTRLVQKEAPEIAEEHFGTLAKQKRVTN